MVEIAGRQRPRPNPVIRLVGRQRHRRGQRQPQRRQHRERGRRRGNRPTRTDVARAKTSAIGAAAPPQSGFGKRGRSVGARVPRGDFARRRHDRIGLSRSGVHQCHDIPVARVPKEWPVGCASYHSRTAGSATRLRREMPLSDPGPPAYDRASMTSLTRYILRQCFGVMVFVTAALSAAVWLAQSLRLIDLIVNRGLSIDIFLYLAVLLLPRFLDIVLPIGVFIAVLFTFNRLTAESELVVMRAAGLSPMALTRPVLILAGSRLCHPDELVALCAAGHQPSLQGSAVRDSQPLRLEPDPRGYVYDDFGQADILHSQPRRQRRRRRPLDQRQPRPPAADHDPCRARRVCRHCGRLANRHGERRPSAIRPANPQAFRAHLRALHARPRQPAGRPGRALSRGAGTLSRRAAVSSPRARPARAEKLFRRIASARCWCRSRCSALH